MTDTLRDIKRRIKTIESTEHITNAMRLVSAAKFRRAKKQYDRFSEAPGKMLNLMKALLEEDCGTTAEPGEEMQSASGGDSLLVVFTSSRGLCGGYNSSILKLAEETAHARAGVKVISIGSRGSEFFRRQGWNLLAVLEEGPEKVTRREAEKLAQEVRREWEEGRAAEILLVGMQYVNTLHQEPAVRRILPAEGGESLHTEIPADMEFLPSRQEVSRQVLSSYLQLVLLGAAAEAAVCEHAARRTAMENAADSARDMMSSLSLTYNRARQQAITEELIEIVSGSESLK